MRAAYHHILLLFLFAFHALVLISIPVQARIFPEQLDICNQVPEYNTLTLKSLRSWLCKSATSSMMENSKKGSPSPPPPPKKAPTPIHDSEYPCVSAGSSECKSLITMVITDHDEYGKKPVRSPPPAPKPRPRPGQLGNPPSSPSDVHGRTSRILPPTPIHDSENPCIAAGSSTTTTHDECNSLITMVITDHDQYGKKPVRSPPPAPKPRPRPGQLGNPPSSPSDVHGRTPRILPPTPIHDSENPCIAAGSSTTTTHDQCNSLITMVITDHDQYGKRPVRSPPPAPKPRPRPGQLGNPPSSPSDVHERTSRIYYLQHQDSSK